MASNSLSAVVNSEHTFKSSWKQPEDVERYLREKCTSRTLNLCSGKSILGDVRVDADISHSPDVLADMNRLPFRDCSFDTVLFDPPWKMNYFSRQNPFFEAVRVAALDGRILFNSRWIGESKMTDLEEVVVRADDKWSNISTIAVHRKHRGQTTAHDY